MMNKMMQMVEKIMMTILEIVKMMMTILEIVKMMMTGAATFGPY